MLASALGARLRLFGQLESECGTVDLHRDPVDPDGVPVLEARARHPMKQP